jgi:2-polyprenyl-3-methyl-5-hydroxy-6-metoxy-1,4-benzoquinol methylase
VRNSSVMEIDTPNALDEIRTGPCPNCYLCGTPGTLLYENLTDRLFGAPGTWNFKQCTNVSCGLIWLDPMPLESDIGKAYKTYYTHSAQSTTSESGIERIKAMLIRFYETLWRFTAVYSERQEVELMYLGRVPPGRVLEIGCGDGRSLAALRDRGWEVHGLDLDEKAVATARQTFGLPVLCSSIGSAGFADEEFDAVVMSHVIEHVHDPIGLLRESIRVLKPGGHLVVITPNTNGWGHRKFGSSWIGMDRPRHLMLFTRFTLERLGKMCGLRDTKSWTTAARSVWTVAGSLRIERGEAIHSSFPLITRAFRQLALHAQALTARLIDADAGDECVLSARR